MAEIPLSANRIGLGSMKLASEVKVGGSRLWNRIIFRGALTLLRHAKDLLKGPGKMLTTLRSNSVVYSPTLSLSEERRVGKSVQDV